MEEKNMRSIFPIIAGGIVILVLGGIIGAAIGSEMSGGNKGDITLGMLEKVRSDHKMTEIVRNKAVYDLESALSQADVDLAAASDMIIKLQQAPDRVKYIAVIKTVIKPGETKTVVIPIKDMPDEKLFSMRVPDGELVVVRLRTKDTNADGVKDAALFDQYAQTFKLMATLSPKKSAFLLTATSDYDGISHDIPVTASVIHVGDEESKHRVVQPGVSMHLGAWAGSKIAGGETAAGYQAGIGMPWLHPLPGLDIMTPEIGFGAALYPGNVADRILYSSPAAPASQKSAGNIRVGFDIASYNLGDNQESVFRDTWIGLDVTVGNDSSVGVGITLSTRL